MSASSKRIADGAQAHDELAEARRALAGARRGQDIVAILAQAQRRWREEPAWRARVHDCVAAFPLKRTADLAQIEEIGECLDPEVWRQRLENELAQPRALDGVYEAQRTGALLGYRALGVVLHVAPGNTFLVAIESLVYGLVAGNVNLVKLSRNVPAVAPIVLELLLACGLPAGQARLLAWDAGDEPIEAAFAGGCEGVVVWGGDEAVRAYRRLVGAGVRLIEYGPRLSFSILSARAFADNDDAALAQLVRDACRYEQVSCSSSQLLFAQRPPGLDAESFKTTLLRRLQAAFAEQARRSPPPAKSADEQVEMLRAQARAQLAKARDSGDYVSGYPDWLVVWKPDAERLEPSPLMRTWIVHPVDELDEVSRLLGPIRHYLYTASVACAGDELMPIAERLWSAGVNRVVAAGRCTDATIGAPHDGGFILPQLCRVASVESPARREQLWRGGDRASTLAALARQVRSANRAPLYAQRFAAAGIVDGALDSWEQFGRIAWLRKPDVHHHGPPHSSDLLTTPFAEVRDATLFTTGGSTGAPTYALYSRPEWDEAVEIFARELATSGVGAQDRVANLFNGGGLWSAFLAVHGAIDKSGALALPLGGNGDPAPTLALLASLGTTALVGLPSTLLRLAHAAEASGTRPPIRTILFGGEQMTAPMRELVARALGAELVKSVGYSAIDAGCIGYQCRHAHGSVHHALERYAYVEICDETTGLPVAPGEEGEIVVTNLSRQLFPVVRLRTGDRGRQLLAPCGCGSSAFTFELLGRSDDMIRIGGANVHVSDVERLCERFAGLLSLLFQLRIGKTGVDDSYELCIETREQLPPDQLALATAMVTRAYLELADEVESYVRSGLLRHFAIRLLPPGSLRGNERTGKVRRVLDTRQ